MTAHRVRILTLVFAVAAVLGASMSPVAAQPSGSTVSTRPTSGTPHVLDGKVLSIAQVGDTIILGGEFTQARNNDDATLLTRSNLLAFNATTGQISQTFVPEPNGPVNVVIPAADGLSVYVGGSFTTVAGQTRKNLVRLRVADGSLVTAFNPGSVAGQVKDLRLVGNRLWVGGVFTHIANSAQRALATINPQSGAIDQYYRGLIAGAHNGGNPTVMKMDVTPAGDRLVAVGNFDTVDGAKHHQIVELDISGPTPTVADFNTTFYQASCSGSFETYMRDVDLSPDGSFFVVATTGAYGGAGSACDSTARFETYGTGTDVRPSWVNNTGGDTTYTVEITDSVVYTGGHARWQNNPFRGDQPGQGAVSRPGIAALDPDNGLPYSWNPTRTRGVGVFDFLVTSQGLWVASDTDRIGDSYLRSRIALLPTGGSSFPATTTPGLPNDIYSAGSTGLSRRSYAGSSFGSGQTVPSGGLNWANVRGAFMINGSLYTAWSDGTFTRRTFDGASYGASESVDTSSALVAMTDWRSDIVNATSMFYDRGRIYFTRAGSSSLFYRFFTPESGVVGAQRLTAGTAVTGLDFSQVKGAFLADGRLYWSTSTGVLRSVQWSRTAQSGGPVDGTVSSVSGPAIDGVSWGAPRALFLFQDTDGDGPPRAPTASFTESCTSLTCQFDASSSSVGGQASISSWSWSFGDGSTATGATPSHVFPATGSYSVSLTVTSSKGRTATITTPVAVARVNTTPDARVSHTCSQMTCTFDGSTSTDPDGAITSYVWEFPGEPNQLGSQVQHVYPSPGTHTATLTVTDNDGASSSQSVTVEVASASVEYVGAGSSNGNRSSHTVTIPSGTLPGDTLLLTVTANSTTPLTPPVGWTPVAAADENLITARVWTRTAQSGDAGSTVSVASGAVVKSDVTLAAYRPSAGASLSVTGAGAATRGVSSPYVTPTVPVASPSAWLVSYWAVKSSDIASIGVPAGATGRTSSQGTGGGNISALFADSGGPVGQGDRGGLLASSTGAPSRSVAFSVVVAAQ